MTHTEIVPALHQFKSHCANHQGKACSGLSLQLSLATLCGALSLLVPNLAFSKPIDKQQPGTTSDRKVAETVRAFLKKHGEERLGVADPQARILGIETDPDFPNQRIVRIQQTVNNVPIWGADGILLVKQEREIVSLSASFFPSSDVRNIAVTPTLHWSEALERALQYYRKHFADARSPRKHTLTPHPATTQLIIVPLEYTGEKENAARLAWMIQLENYFFLIDAQDGSLIFQYDNLQSATHNRWTYDLEDRDQYWLGHCMVLNESGPVLPPGPDCNNPNTPPSTEAIKAHSGAAESYIYFKNSHGRESYNNNKYTGRPGPLGTIESNVRVSELETIGHWNPDNKMLIYRSQTPNALDVMGHEFTHGVIQFSAGLMNFKEPGALNESISDFFGNRVEAHANPSSHNWTIGENLPGGYIRDMANPHLNGFNPTLPYHSQTNRGQPDHYSEKVTHADLLCSSLRPGDGDRGCPHINSGIFNKLLFLASDGGTHHGVTVSGMGKSTVARVLYRALTTRMSALTDMECGAKMLLSACKDIIFIGKGCLKLTKAIVAVGIPVTNNPLPFKRCQYWPINL